MKGIGKTYDVTDKQREFLQVVLNLGITRWKHRIKRILAESMYDDLDRIKMNEVRLEYHKYLKNKQS